MVRAGPEVVDPVLAHFLLERGLATPVRVLPPVVGQHLLRRPVLTPGPPVHFQQVVRRLGAIHTQPGDVPREVVYESQQVGILPAQAKAEYIALPHLVGSTALEEPRLLRVLLGFLFQRDDQLFPVQGPSDRLVTCRQHEYPPQDLRYAPDSKRRVMLLDLGDLCGYCGRRIQCPVDSWLRLQPFFSVQPVIANPVKDSAFTGPHFLCHNFGRHPFFQIQTHRFPFCFIRKPMEMPFVPMAAGDRRSPPWGR